jgi:hypothetical protein
VKNIFLKKINLWVVVLIVFILVAAAAVWIIFFNQTIYKYSFPLPQGQVVVSSLQYGSQPTLSNPDYFKNVVNSLIEQKAAFLEADLSTMQLSAYIGGRLVKQVPILAKGMEGSWWQTPAGMYEIDLKEPSHFSSIAKVYFRWSMEFQGNFFIHGWPYYKNGQKVSSAYSGGCIRLSDEDAKAIYEITVVGEPVLVFTNQPAQDSFQYQKKIPGITAQSYLAVDIKDNFVFFEGASRDIKPAASAAKLITAMVSMDYINLDKTITVKKEMIVPTSKPRLQVGQKVNLYDFLYPLLLESSNEAAEVLSLQLGKERFVGLMNEKVKAIGMQNSSLEDASGSGNNDISNAEDLFTLAKYIYNNKNFIFKLTSQKLDYSFYGQPSFSNLENYNAINEQEFVGGEWGKTDSGEESMLSVFEIQKDGAIRPIAIEVLGSSDARKDTETIFNYIKDSFF